MRLTSASLGSFMSCGSILQVIDPAAKLDRNSMQAANLIISWTAASTLGWLAEDEHLQR
jgi:hypothetical protein